MNPAKLFNGLLAMLAMLTLVAVGLFIYSKYIDPAEVIPATVIVVVPGPPGPAGATGAKGAAGAIGATGRQGSDGRTGATGAQGAQGSFWGK